MNTISFNFTNTLRKSLLARSIFLCFAAMPSFALAQADGSLNSVERLHQTTLGILEALVAKGILTKADADAIVETASDKAKQVPVAPTAASGMGVRPAAGPDAVRVPYIPEMVKREIREEIRKDILVEAKKERWVSPNSMPDWVSGIKVSGDVRVRAQSDRVAASSGGATQYFDSEDVTNFAGLNNLENQSRVRIRARLAIDADINAKVQAGIRLSTGNQLSPVSSSSTSGDPSNRFGFKIDRAFIRYKPLSWLQVDAGRVVNPFLNTELMFAPDLGFDGFSTTVRPKFDTQVSPFMTLGTFPLRNNPFAGNRRMNGAQLGAAWDFSEKSNIKFALSRYSFVGAAGVPLDDSFDPAYNSSEYESGYRQRGNTLFRINQDPLVTAAPVYGLASKFNVNSIYAALELKHFDPTRLLLSAESIVNKGFDEGDVNQRVNASQSIGSRNKGYMVRMLAGTPVITRQGQWQLGFGVRKLERDATLDALTDPNFVFGGTNVKGQFITLGYGIEKNTSLGLRYLSGETIDAPIFNPNLQPIKVRTIQLDMNVRF